MESVLNSSLWFISRFLSFAIFQTNGPGDGPLFSFGVDDDERGEILMEPPLELSDYIEDLKNHLDEILALRN